MFWGMVEIRLSDPWPGGGLNSQFAPENRPGFARKEEGNGLVPPTATIFVQGFSLAVSFRACVPHVWFCYKQTQPNSFIGHLSAKKWTNGCQTSWALDFHLNLLLPKKWQYIFKYLKFLQQQKSTDSSATWLEKQPQQNLLKIRGFLTIHRDLEASKFHTSPWTWKHRIASKPCMKLEIKKVWMQLPALKIVYMGSYIYIYTNICILKKYVYIYNSWINTLQKGWCFNLKGLFSCTPSPSVWHPVWRIQVFLK